MRSAFAIGVSNLIRPSRFSAPIVIALAALTGLMPNAAPAQTEPARVPNGAKFGAWTVQCQAPAVGESQCFLQQDLRRAEDQAFVATLVAFWGTGEEPAPSMMIARVPNGAFLPAGFGLKPDEESAPVSFVWQQCGRDLCEAAAAIPRETMQTLAQSDGVIGGFRPQRGAQDLLFQVDMTGLVAGMDALNPDASE